MEPFVIRSMTPADVIAVATIDELMYPYPWTEGIFYDCLSVGHEGFVLSDNDQIVGYAMISSGAGEAHLLNLCVDAPFGGQGYGRGLLDHVLTEIRRKDVDQVFLEVRSSNFIAIHLYRTTGFQRVGVRKGYYPAIGCGREDAVVMSLAIR